MKRPYNNYEVGQFSIAGVGQITIAANYKRFEAHLNGSARCKYTRSFLPLRIAQSWEVRDKPDALRLELKIKKLDRQGKVQLINNPDLLCSLYD